MQKPHPVDRSAFDIAIICALPEESNAVEATFDCFLEDDELHYGKAAGDPNAYTFGMIGRHYVVLAYMPGMGKASSASLAASFRASFPKIRLCLVVGVCGGVPQLAKKDPDNETKVFLGDVIISTGVVQSDFGRQYAHQFIRKDTVQDNLGRPNSEIRAFLHKLGGRRARDLLRQKVSGNISEICSKEGFASWARPAVEEDKLYRDDYAHIHRDPAVCSICAQSSEGLVVCERALTLSCKQLGCDESQVVPRERRTDDVPAIYFGRIASSDQVMKSALDRNRLANQEGIVGFEMEGAGVWDNLPTIIVKGVCDYADSHKSKKWQKYTSVAAAACAKALLGEWRVVNQDTTYPGSTRAEERRPEADAANDIGKGVVFNNHAQVGNQGVHQTFNGNFSFHQGGN